MRCAWKELLDILPKHLRSQVDHIGKENLQELRLRINAPPEMVLAGGVQSLSEVVKQEDLDFVLNTASQYSPWQRTTLSQGYLTAPGGHRIGLCGEVIYRDGQIHSIRNLHSLCIRVAKDYSGLIRDISALQGSVLILGAPGWGKTTLLRDLARELADRQTVAVADERGELYPNDFLRGKRMDILTGCPKVLAVEMLLRTMGPEWIVLDEITAREDCEALIRAANCGVRLAATAHAASRQDLLRRPVYRPLTEEGILETLLILRPDKTWRLERMTL